MNNYSSDDIIEILRAYLSDTPERYEYLIDIIADCFGMTDEELIDLINN
jgi:hypothetical protein